MDELGKKIEESYNGILEAVKKINMLAQTIDDLKNTTTGIIDKYAETIIKKNLKKQN